MSALLDTTVGNRFPCERTCLRTTLSVPASGGADARELRHLVAFTDPLPYPYEGQVTLCFPRSLLGWSALALLSRGVLPFTVGQRQRRHAGPDRRRWSPVHLQSQLGRRLPPALHVPFGMVQWTLDTPSRPLGGSYEHNYAGDHRIQSDSLSGPVSARTATCLSAHGRRGEHRGDRRLLAHQRFGPTGAPTRSR